MGNVRFKKTKRKIKNIKARRDIKRVASRKALLKRDSRFNVRITPIPKARFEALSYARAPMIKLISEEIEWFSNQDASVLGTILIDKIDEDYILIIIGRDEAGVFRYIDGKVSIADLSRARDCVFSLIAFHTLQGSSIFSQGVIKRSKNVIFKPIVSPNAMLDDYKKLVYSGFFSPAKKLVEEIAYSFEDPDGNYIEQFQSSGFNSRLFELYLYALFHEQNFEINREFNAPDYVLEKNSERICIEAVTVNANVSRHGLADEVAETNAEKEKLLNDYIPIKYGSSLYSKLCEKYWEKEHVKKHPLIIAIHDFHQTDSMYWTRSGLETYLYGAKRSHNVNENGGITTNVDLVKSHSWKGKTIPSDFFSQLGAENISAVIHSNQATIGKFLRMGFLAEFGRRDLDIMVEGQAYYGNTPVPTNYQFDVTKQGYEEFWDQSVTVYHNPNAKIPLNYQLFDGVAQVIFKDGKFHSIKPQFYPLYCRTLYKEQSA